VRERLRPFADGIIGLFLVVLVDVLAFHAGWYYPWLLPQSYSGRTEASMRRFAELRAATPLRHVVVMSNSTGARCIDESLLESGLQSAGWLAVANLAQGGTTARSWYVLLRSAPVNAATTAVVVLGVHPHTLAQSEHQPDVSSVKTRLEIGDLGLLAGSYTKLETRLRVALGTVLRTPLFREDLVALLANPAARLAAVRAARDEERTNPGRRIVLASKVDLSSARLGPDGELDLAVLAPRHRADPKLAGVLRAQLRRRELHPDAPTPPIVIEEVQAKMFRATVRMLTARGVAVVVAMTPEGAWPSPGHPIGPLEQLVTELRAEGARIAIFQDLPMLETVENPLYFADVFHTNQAGAQIYTRSLTTFLDAALAGAQLGVADRRAADGSGTLTAGSSPQ
jgi:hypothetical protein